MTGNVNRRQKPNKLESLWDDLLSRQPERVRAGYASLAASEQKTIYDHLQRMAGEPGWQPEQRLSAQIALSALENQEQ